MKRKARNHDLTKILMICLAWLLGSSQLFGSEPVNQTCPVTPGEPIDPGITTTYQGQTIALCCKSCLRKFNRDPEAYLAELKATSSFPESGDELRHTMVETPLEHDQGQDHPHSSHVPSPTESVEGTGLHQNSSPAHDRSEDSHHSTGHDDETAAAAPHSDDINAVTAHSHFDSSETPHNHATDHTTNTESTSVAARAVQYLGKLHVLAVHLPIAFLPFAAFFELVGWIRHRGRLTDIGRILFTIGATGAIVAASLGWLAAQGANYPGELALYLDWHRWAGTVSALFGLLGLLGLLAPRVGMPWGIVVYRIAAVVLGLFIPITAHLGGSLIYGADYLF